MKENYNHEFRNEAILAPLHIRVNEIMVCDIYISLTHIYRYDISVYPAIKVNNNSVFYEHLQFIHTNKTDDMYQTVSSSSAILSHHIMTSTNCTCFLKENSSFNCLTHTAQSKYRVSDSAFLRQKKRLDLLSFRAEMFQ